MTGCPRLQTIADGNPTLQVPRIVHELLRADEVLR
jgi:hypothetical protein